MEWRSRRRARIEFNSGHHHLLIDADLPPLDEPIPSDFNHLHFGAGETETDLELTPGPHTLQLLLGDSNHVPHTPPIMSERIHVNVVEAPSTPVAQAAPAPVAQKQSASQDRRTSPPGAKAYIISPSDGAAVPLTFVVRFGLDNMGVAPAGVDRANSGHHHLLIDTPLPPLDEPIPSDENHLHFGDGETAATITLAPGRHTLQLLLGDANHVPHVPPVFSQPITIVAGNVGPREPRAQRQAPARVVRAPRKPYEPAREQAHLHRHPAPQSQGPAADKPQDAAPYAGQGGASIYFHPNASQNP